MNFRRFAGSLLIMVALALGAACSPQTPEELFAEAQQAIASGDIGTANIHLRNLLQDNPDHLPARALLAEVALALGDVTLAEQSALRVIESGAEASSSHLVLLQALEAQGRFVDLADHFDQMPALSDDTAQGMALAIVGSAWQSMGVLDVAEQNLRDALTLLPDSPEVLTRLGSILLSAGKGDEARQRLSDALQLDSRYTPALNVRAMIELQANQIAAAAETLREVLEIEQSNRRGAQYLAASARLVEVQLAQGELEAASVSADNFLRANPGHPLARYVKAATEFASGDLEVAEQRLQALIADAPQYWQAYGLLGQIDAKQGQWGQAQQNLSAAVNNNPGDPVARLHLAAVFVRQGDMDRARQLFPDAEISQLSDDLFLALVGSASLQAGQSELAESYFDSSASFIAEDAAELRNVVAVLVASGQFERALRTIEEAESSSDDDRLIADYLTTSVHIAAGNLDAAATLSDRLLQERPELAWTHSLRGSVAMGEQDVAAARSYFAEAARIEPNNISTLLVLANLEASDGNEAAAEQLLQRIVAAEPGQPNAVLGLAQLALRRNDTEAARSWMRQAPESLQRTQVLGGIDAAEGNFTAAADAFASVFDAQPTFEAARLYYMAASSDGRPDPAEKLLSWLQSNPLEPRANAMLGSVALAAQDYDEAIERFELVLNAEPDSAPILNNLAWLYDERGDDRAMDYAERAYALAPQLPAIADTLGWMLLEQGESERALVLLEQAAAGAPDAPEILYHFASALIENDRTEVGVQVLNSALAMAGEFPWRADAEELLRTTRNAQ